MGLFGLAVLTVYSQRQLTDARVVSLLLQERPENTRSVYLGDAGKLFSFLSRHQLYGLGCWRSITHCTVRP